MITTTAVSVKYDYDPNVTKYSVPYQWREDADIKAHYYDGTLEYSLWIWRDYIKLTEGEDYSFKDGIFTLLRALPAGSVLEIFRATMPLQTAELTRAYDDSITRNTMCIQELRYWLHHWEHELRQFEHFARHEIEDFKGDFAGSLDKIQEELENFHTAELSYVLQLARYMTLLLRYAEEKLLTDLRYPISDYRPAEETYGLDTAVLIIQGKQIIRINDEGECDV